MKIAKENILHKKFFINIVQLISILKWTYMSWCLGPRRIPRPGCYAMVIKIHLATNVMVLTQCMVHANGSPQGPHWHKPSNRH